MLRRPVLFHVTFIKKICRPISIGIHIVKTWSDHVLLDFGEQLVGIIAVSGELDRLEQVEREDAHDRLCVDDVATGGQVDVDVILGNSVYEVAYVRDG